MCTEASDDELAEAFELLKDATAEIALSKLDVEVLAAMLKVFKQVSLASGPAAAGGSLEEYQTWASQISVALTALQAETEARAADGMTKIVEPIAG